MLFSVSAVLVPLSVVLVSGRFASDKLDILSVILLTRKSGEPDATQQSQNGDEWSVMFPELSGPVIIVILLTAFLFVGLQVAHWRELGDDKNMAVAFFPREGFAK